MYEYQNKEIPIELNFITDIHGPDGFVSCKDVLQALIFKQLIETLLQAERDAQMLKTAAD